MLIDICQNCWESNSQLLSKALLFQPLGYLLLFNCVEILENWNCYCQLIELVPKVTFLINKKKIWQRSAKHSCRYVMYVDGLIGDACYYHTHIWWELCMHCTTTKTSKSRSTNSNIINCLCQFGWSSHFTKWKSEFGLVNMYMVPTIYARGFLSQICEVGGWHSSTRETRQIWPLYALQWIFFPPHLSVKFLVYNKKNTWYKAFLKGPVKNLDSVLIGTCSAI